MISRGEESNDSEPVTLKMKPQRPHPAIRGLRFVYHYQPQPDLTVSEVSEVLELFMMGFAVAACGVPPRMVDLVFASLSDETQRHFAVEPLSNIVIPNS